MRGGKASTLSLGLVLADGVKPTGVGAVPGMLANACCVGGARWLMSASSLPLEGGRIRLGTDPRRTPEGGWLFVGREWDDNKAFPPSGVVREVVESCPGGGGAAQARLL